MSKMFAYINREGISQKLTIEELEKITNTKEKAKEIWEYAKGILDGKKEIGYGNNKTEKKWFQSDGKESYPRLIQVYVKQRTVVAYGYNFNIEEFNEIIDRYRKGYRFRISTDSRLMKNGENPETKCVEMMRKIITNVDKLSEKYGNRNVKIYCWNEKPSRWWCGEGTGNTDQNCYGYEITFQVSKLWNKEKPSWNEVMSEINKVYAPHYKRMSCGKFSGRSKKEIGIENIGESAF